MVLYPGEKKAKEDGFCSRGFTEPLKGKGKEEKRRSKPCKTQERVFLQGTLVYPEGLVHLLWTVMTRAAVRSDPRAAAQFLILPSSKAGMFIPAWRCHRWHHTPFLGQAL